MMNQIHPESDIHQDYKSANDCLVQCSSTIRSLQHHLASKDRRIRELEKKLVQMSVELASSKAKGDKPQCMNIGSSANDKSKFERSFVGTIENFKRMLSGSDHDAHNNESNEENDKGDEDTFLVPIRSELSSYVPQKNPRKNVKPSVEPTKEPPIPNVIEFAIPNVIELEQSTEKNVLSKHKAISQTQVQESLDKIIPNVIELEQSTENVLSKHKAISQTPVQEPLNKSFSVRRISDLGQYLLETFNANDSPSSPAPPDLASGAPSPSTTVKKCTVVAKAKRRNSSKHSQRGLRRKSKTLNDLYSSSGSLISAVVFPVTSRDVLMACNDGPGRHYATNEEWPEF